jgi:hypothetical protein
MSNSYAESNGESTARLFNKRFMYKMRSKRSVAGAKNIVDFTIGERKLYGKVNQLYRPMFVKYESRLKPLNWPGTDTDTQFFAFNFVADLFNEMVRDFQRCMAKGQISKTDPYLSNLKVYRAYENPMVAFTEYQNIFFNSIKRKFIDRSIMVEDFDHFMKIFMSMASRVCKETPFTFTSYIKSDFNNIMTSGLAIELSDLSYVNDDEKIESFINSKNWAFFVNACNKYGFLIDYNVPWRIVCDLKAPEIQLAISNYYSSVNQVFDLGFSRTSVEDVLMLPRILLQLYNTVKVNKFKKQIICSGRVKDEVISPPSYTIQQILQEKGFNYFLKIYMKLRLAEENLPMPKEQEYFLLKDVIEYVNIRDDVLAVENYFERYLSLPFDKTYSYTYNMNVVYEKLAKKLQDGEESYSVKMATQAMTGY